MPAIQHFAPAAIDLGSLPLISDNECLVRLAAAVEIHDDDRLDELALLISRLAVTIEL